MQTAVLYGKKVIQEQITATTQAISALNAKPFPINTDHWMLCDGAYLPVIFSGNAAHLDFTIALLTRINIMTKSQEKN